MRVIFKLLKMILAGEDGLIKIWSRSGMLRSTVVTSDNSVYGAAWSPDSQAIAYTHGKCIVIKQLAPNLKPLRVSIRLFQANLACVIICKNLYFFNFDNKNAKHSKINHICTV